jgi:hypothetical protein
MPRIKAWSIVALLSAVYVMTGLRSAGAQTAATYESLKGFPDMAGSWTPLTPPFVLPPVRPASERTGAAPQTTAACTFPPEVKQEVVARCQDPGLRLERRDLLCARPAFVGRPPAGAGGAFEILFTPGRVTMASEPGLVRRIYLRDSPLSGALDESRGGNSIGRWEGATLVIETTGLDPDARFAPGSPLGRGARVMERITLVDANTLRIEATLTAPAVLTAPATFRQQYRRAPDRVFTDFDTCVQSDRSLDLTTGQERFDRTPPADLPPPPAQ